MSTLRNYIATIILDTRGYEEPVESLVEKLKDILTELGAKVGETRNLGRKDFIRVTEKGHTGDSYVEFSFEGPASLPSALQEKVRLDRTVKRVMVRSA